MTILNFDFWAEFSLMTIYAFFLLLMIGVSKKYIPIISNKKFFTLLIILIMSFLYGLTRSFIFHSTL